MPSIIPGFEYDIFISYRQNDNRSGWVTDFANALQEELSATIKEPLSIYFDKNPHTGLLDTDIVSKSLEGKLKCLIFIPIISQTYCDPLSFAWQHEFCTFNKLSGQDKFGKDIKLINGNVTSRMLAVKIHELDSEDKALIEHTIGGPLRAIEFIFRSSGVNRPLRLAEEHAHDNLNYTFYRDQVNKVANTIKAIIQAAKGSADVRLTQPATAISRSDTSNNRKPAARWIFAVFIALAVIAFWKFNSGTRDVANNNPDKSLVVLPFADLSPKKDQEWFSDGLTEELLNSLSSLEDLKLISRTTSFSFKGKGLSAKRIADSLGVAHVLEGSVRRADDQLRVTVQLIKAHDDTHLWSHVYEYTIDSVFKIQSDISKNVANTLNILLDDETREEMNYAGTANVEAYELFLKAKAIYGKAHTSADFDLLYEANKLFERAIQTDPNFAVAYYDHADIYSHSLLAAASLKSLRHLSERQQYNMMMHDINKAISLTKDPGRRIGYSFTRDIFSSDWTHLTSYINVKENWSSGWEPFLAVIHPEFIARRYGENLEFDPYADMQRYFKAIGLANMNKLDSALALYKIDYTKSYLNARVKSFLHFRNGDYPNALNAFSGFASDSDGYYLFLKILNEPNAYNRAELDRQFTSYPLVDSYGYSPILAYNALGDFRRADSIAAVIDKRLVGHFSLCYHLLEFGLYFHLSATPNFAARLNELGIDTAAYQRRLYKRIPDIKEGI